MDTICSEISEEKDITHKRRLSSILKAPRTPLCDIGSGNELNQDFNIEKRQRNSRRVSFADTIRVFPPDLQNIVELKHGETTREVRDQDPFNKNEDPEDVQCEITGMNTLLHAPIQTHLQQIECPDANTGTEWNKMDRTVIFSEENEMDMTSGHTILITHDIGFCQKTDQPKKIDFKSFSTALKSKKEGSQLNEFSFFSGPIKANETCLSQEKMKTENIQKINFNDFLKNLKSSQMFPTPTPTILHSEAQERNINSSDSNEYSHLQGKRCNITAALGELDNKENYIMLIPSDEKAVAPASNQLGSKETTLVCREGSMDAITANIERVLPHKTSSLNMVDQQGNLRCDYSVNYKMHKDSSEPSSNQPGVQQDSSMCTNELTVSSKEDVDKMQAVRLINRAASLASSHGTSTIPVPTGFATSMPILHGNKSVFSSFYTDREISKSCTDLVHQRNFSGIGNPIHGASEKESYHISRLTEETLFREDYMDITKHQESTNYYINSIQSCEIAAPNQEATYDGMELLNPRINPGSWTSCLPERKAHALFGSSSSKQSTLFSLSQGSKSFEKEKESYFVSLSEDIRQCVDATGLDSKINRESVVSHYAVSLIPEDKSGVSVNMEITKPMTYIMDNSLNTAIFQGLPQQEMRASKKCLSSSDGAKTIVFALNEDNEMEITKSCTVPVNYNMQKCERTPQELSLHSVDKTGYSCYDMDETKPISSAINHSIGNAGGQSEKPSNESGRRAFPGSAKDRTVVYLHSDENEMDITRSHTVALNHDAVIQGEKMLSNQTAMVTCAEDMEITKPVSSVTAVPEQNTRTGKKRITESASDQTALFSLSKDNEMELTRSLTVAVERVPQTLSLNPTEKTNMYLCNNNMELTKSTSFGPADKTLVFMHNNDMEITKSISLQDTGFRTLQLNKKEVDKFLTESANEQATVCGLLEDNEMEITRSHTVAVNHDIVQQVREASQGLFSVPANKASMFVDSGNTTITKSTTFLPADKTVRFLCNNDMEITKSISSQDTSFGALQLNKKEVDKFLTESANEQATVCGLLEDNEMEITRSHTVAVNHDIVQHVREATPGLFSVPADKASMFVDSGNTTLTKSTTFLPADKTVRFLCNNDMEITKSLSDAILKNSQYKSLPQKREDTGSITLPGSPKDNTTVLALHDEMEFTKCHTVAVNHDVASHCERTPQVLSHTLTEETFPKNALKLGNYAECQLPSQNMVALTMADGAKVAKGQTAPTDSQTVVNCPQSSQAKNVLPVNEAFTYHQGGTEVTALPTNTVENGNWAELEEQEMLNENIQQTLSNVLTPMCAGEVHNAEAARNCTVNIYDPNNYGPGFEKQLSSSSTNSKVKISENTAVENMEMTKNYTIGIECMYMNDKNESSLHSRTKSSSEFPASVDAYETKLNGSEVNNDTPERSIYSADMMLSISQGIVQEQQNHFKHQDNQPESCMSKMNTFAKQTARNVVSNEANNVTFPVKMLVLDSKTRQEDNFATETATHPIDDRVSNIYETLLSELGGSTKDQQNNSEFPPMNSSSSDEEPVLLPKRTVISHCPILEDIGKKSEPVLLSQDVGSSLGKELSKLPMKPDEPLQLREDVKKEPTITKEGTHTYLSEGASLNVHLNTVCTDSCKVKKIPLSIFPPKLPSRIKPAISNVEDTSAKSGERTAVQDSEINLLLKRSSEKIAQNLSPSCYIDEELLPACIEEMDSNESLSCDVMNSKGILAKEGHLFEESETNKRQKRTWISEDEELQKEKKLKVDDAWNDTAELKQPLSSTVVAHNPAETLDGKNVPEVMATNLEKTQNSNCSSLDSVKADIDFSIQRNSETTQLLMDSICEQNLQEKLQEGTITVREFFTLLQVHALIQKPRQSQLPPKYAVTTPPTPEDEILSQFIYRPKLEVYEEDCHAFCKVIEELKLHAVDQDKLLANMHKSLWEVMRTCSDEELKSFGAELNKQKSYFTKKSKVLAHRRKAQLYAKLVQSAQFQRENLQSRLAKMDKLMKEIDSCIVALKTETALLEDSEPDVSDTTAEYEAKLRETERELENCRAQEEALQRNQSNLREKKQQLVSEISHLQKDATNRQELMQSYNFSEWVIKEWNDHQAVFTFLYDTIELTVGLGFPIDGTISSNKVCQKIVSLHFESLLDEAKALPSSKLVHKLIFQFINSQSSWQENCSTMYQLSQVLRDISLVVSRCQFLGEEIEFLNRWGGKFYLLKTEVNDTKVKLLFSSSTALAKFEVEFSLSASYPASPIVFSIQKCAGGISQEEISMALSSVPVGANYLKRIVKQISHNLLQHPMMIHKQQRTAIQ